MFYQIDFCTNGGVRCSKYRYTISVHSLMAHIDKESALITCLILRIFEMHHELRAVLNRLQSLQHLDLRNITHDDACWQAITSWIAANNSLRSLTVYLPNILPVVDILCESVVRSKSIETIEIVLSHYNILLLVPIMQRITKSEQIKSVSLPNCSLSHVCDKLESLVQENFSIVSFRVDGDVAGCAEVTRRNKYLTWPAVRKTIIHVAAALHALELPLYVVLAIIDALPFYNRLRFTQYEKVDVLERVFASISRISRRKACSFNLIY